MDHQEPPTTRISQCDVPLNHGIPSQFAAVWHCARCEAIGDTEWAEQLLGSVEQLNQGTSQAGKSSSRWETRSFHGDCWAWSSRVCLDVLWLVACGNPLPGLLQQNSSDISMDKAHFHTGKGVKSIGSYGQISKWTTTEENKPNKPSSKTKHFKKAHRIPHSRWFYDFGIIWLQMCFEQQQGRRW